MEKFYDLTYGILRNLELPHFLEQYNPIILNKEAIIPNESKVFTGNHKHERDQNLVIASTEEPIRWYAKDEYFHLPTTVNLLRDIKKRYPGISEEEAIKRVPKLRRERLLFLAMIKSTGVIPIVRENGADNTKSFQRSDKTLQSGRNIGVFSEGKRTNDQDVGEFKPGAVISAKKNNAYVQPFAVNDSGFIKGGKRPAILFGDAYKVDPEMPIQEAVSESHEKVHKLALEVKKYG